MSGPTLISEDHATKPDDETDLVDRAVAGDREAFARLYDLHYERVFRHVYYRVGSREEAKDLTQESFLQAWRGLPRYRRTESPFTAWLFAIVHHVVVGFYRRSKPVDYLQRDLPEWRTSSDPQHQAEMRWESERVRKAILRLTHDQQQVTLMRFLEQLGYNDIAAALGKTAVSVRVIQHRALRELRRLLEREGP